MRIEVGVSYDNKTLEQYRPRDDDVSWELVASGYWSETAFHSGHIAYYLAQIKQGCWILESVERNACLDGVTEEDVEEGRLNDDQLQALWQKGLDEARNEERRTIVAVCTGARDGIEAEEVAQLLYDRVCEAGGTQIDEPDEADGLLSL
jgi:hypothetical protein